MRDFDQLRKNPVEFQNVIDNILINISNNDAFDVAFDYFYGNFSGISGVFQKYKRRKRRRSYFHHQKKVHDTAAIIEKSTRKRNIEAKKHRANSTARNLQSRKKKDMLVELY